MSGCRLALAVLLSVAATSLQAHDTWLLADSGDPPAAPVRRLNLSSSMAFPVPDYAPMADRVQRAWGLSDSVLTELPKPVRGRKALVFKAAASGQSAAYAVQLLPKTLTLDRDEVLHYLDEIHAGPELRQRWEQQAEPRRWREQYIKHSKTLVTSAGVCPGLAQQPMGLGLELLLETDACALQAGDALPVRALHNGQAKPGLVLALVAAGGRELASAATDAEGRARFVVPTAGAWLLRGTDLRPSSAAGLDWQSDFTTLTFVIH